MMHSQKYSNKGNTLLYREYNAHFSTMLTSCHHETSWYVIMGKDLRIMVQFSDTRLKMDATAFAQQLYPAFNRISTLKLIDLAEFDWQ